MVRAPAFLLCTERHRIIHKIRPMPEVCELEGLVAARRRGV